MKVIIDIPEVYYEALSKTEEIISSQRNGKTLMSVIYSAVGNGIPLDDVKAKILKRIDEHCARTLEILDNIGKESEEA